MYEASGSGSSTTTGSSRRRIIKLYCPSVSKLVVAEEDEDQRVDLGLISRTFGLDPATIKLNRHFLSRGLDFISSSLTWKSLFSFFASRGFPTGCCCSSNSKDAPPLIVDGKLCKSGTKRGHDPSCSKNWDDQSSGCDNSRIQRSDTKLKKLRIDDNKAGTSEEGKDHHQATRDNGFCLKRKPTLEDDSVLKKKKMSLGNSGSLISDIHPGYSCVSGSKRIQGDETSTIMASHYKKAKS